MHPRAIELNTEIQPAWSLAQSSGGTGEVLLWLGILIVITIGGGLLVLAVRRRMSVQGDDLDAAGTLMDRLRGMRDRGEITVEEYEQTRSAMRNRMKEKLRDSPKLTKDSHPRP